MDFKEFIQWGFEVLLTGSCVYGVQILGSLKESIDELNIKMAQIIEKTSGHEKTLDRHDERLTRIEDKL